MAKKLVWIVVLLAAPFGPPDNRGQSPLLVGVDTRVTNVYLSDVPQGHLFEYKSLLFVTERKKPRRKNDNTVFVRRVGELNKFEKSTWAIGDAVTGWPGNRVVSMVEIHPQYAIGKTDEERLADPKNIGK